MYSPVKFLQRRPFNRRKKPSKYLTIRVNISKTKSTRPHLGLLNVEIVQGWCYLRRQISSIIVLGEYDDIIPLKIRFPLWRFNEKQKKDIRGSYKFYDQDKYRDTDLRFWKVKNKLWIFGVELLFVLLIWFSLTYILVWKVKCREPKFSGWLMYYSLRRSEGKTPGQTELMLPTVRLTLVHYTFNITKCYDYYTGNSNLTDYST